jgi:hypothetical protein
MDIGQCDKWSYKVHTVAVEKRRRGKAGVTKEGFMEEMTFELNCKCGQGFPKQMRRLCIQR